MRGRLCSAAYLAVVLLVLSQPALAAKRVALVIGIGDYQSLSKLPNPVADAKAIAGVLRANGFQVSEFYDVARADLFDALENFSLEAQGASVALVYYAGHGMEIGGKNVLAPRDMEIDCDHQTPKRALSISALFNALGNADHQVVLLDACRNNPFPSCASSARGSQANGFNFRDIVVEAKSEGHTLLIANSTLSDKLAADGAVGDHSPFAKALIAHSSETNVPLRDLLDSVAADVNEASNGAQIPEITTRGGAPRVCLSETGCGSQPAKSDAPQANVTPPPAPNFDPAAEAWEAAKSTKSVAVLDLLIAKFPGTVYAELARERREELSAAVVQQPPVEPPHADVPQPPRQAIPSFPCSRAKLPTEIAICNSADLADLDVMMAEAYATALLRAGERYIKDRQRVWLGRRNACGYDAPCIERLYRDQIRFLQNAG